jgi:hypothetical protein
LIFKLEKNTHLANISKPTNMPDGNSQDKETTTAITADLGIAMEFAVNISPVSEVFELPRYPAKDPTGQYANGKSSCSDGKACNSNVTIAYNRAESVFSVQPGVPSSTFQGQSNRPPTGFPPSSPENAYGGLELGFEPMESSSQSSLPTLLATHIPHRGGRPSFPILHQRPASSSTYGPPHPPPLISEYEYNPSSMASTALIPYHPNSSQAMTDEFGSDGSAYSDDNGENGK